MFIYSGCSGVVPFRLHKQCEDARCDLMFPHPVENAFSARVWASLASMTRMRLQAQAQAQTRCNDCHTVSVTARTTLL